MILIKNTVKLITLLLIVSLGHNQNYNESFRSEYYAVLPFWESPYQPFKLAVPMTKGEAEKRIHVQVDYDSYNRIIASHVKIGKNYKDYEGFFGNLYINAPLTRVTYNGDKELHRFYDRHGNRINVQGNVFEKVYTKDRYGRNTRLIFFDSNKNETVDQIGVKSYNWIHQKDGSIIEERLNEKNEIVPLRGHFDLKRTRMIFDHQGYFKTLQNIDQEGNIINTKNGVAAFHYYYDQQGRFYRWEVYDEKGEKAIGPSSTSGEQNTFYTYDLENILFFDVNGDPATHWSGAERWHFEVDKYGNRILLEFQDSKGNPMNATNGFSKYLWKWSEDGRFLLSEAFFDKEGKPVIHKQTGVHSTVYIRNKEGMVISKVCYDIRGKIANRKDGIAMVKIHYDKKNKELKRVYYDKNKRKIEKN